MGVGKGSKSNSKRCSRTKKFNNLKRAKQRERKGKKLLKKSKADGSYTQMANKQALHLPNLHPFKAKLLLRNEKRRQLAEKRGAAKAKRFNSVNGPMAKPVVIDDAAQLDQLAAAARVRGRHFDESAAEAEAVTEEMGAGDAAVQTKRAYFKQLKKVIESADVILEVLDARDPEGCRTRAVEAAILARGSGKRIVLVLNKIDLVPRDVARGWLAHLRREYPAIAFKASTQQQHNKLSRVQSGARAASALDDSKAGALQSSKCVGADSLLSLLKNYSRNRDIKTAITVGVMGYPNVGKSSLINSLKRSRVAGVSSVAGFTKALQEVQLDKHVKLIDCPGIIFGTTQSAGGSAGILLRNCVSVDALVDPVGSVGALLERVESVAMMEHYSIPSFDSLRQFLVNVGTRRGKLMSGGVVDREATARLVLRDWNEGKIPFFTPVPEEDAVGPDGDMSSGVHVAAAIVSDWAKEFDIASVRDDAVLVVGRPDSGDGIALRAGTPASPEGSEDNGMVFD